MWEQILNNYTLQIVLIGTVLLGIVSGIIGVFLTLKKEALVGDALSHATLPGVVLAYIFTHKASLFVSIIGAILAAGLAIGLMQIIKKYSKIKSDTVLAIVLSAFFGFGEVLLSIIRDTAGQNQARLKTFIFGQAATMSFNDVYFLLGILTIVLLTVILFYRHFKVYIFNREFYQSLGYSTTLISILLNALTVFVVVSGIQSVGIILMSELLIAPAVAAKLWSQKLLNNLLLASLFGGMSGLFGTIYGTNLSTGPVIVVFASGIVLISILIAPKTGFIWKKVTTQIHKTQIKKYHGLIHLFAVDNEYKFEKKDINLFLQKKYLTNINNNYQLTQKGVNKVVNIMIGSLK